MYQHGGGCLFAGGSHEQTSAVRILSPALWLPSAARCPRQCWQFKGWLGRQMIACRES
jgi:hypothetical protein